MTVEKYRKNLDNFNKQFKIGYFIQRISKGNEYALIEDLFMNSFLYDCTDEQIKELKKELAQLYTDCKTIIAELDKPGVHPFIELE